MNALVYHGPGKRSYEDKPMPIIKDKTDAIVRITKTTICGTDLHIMKGAVPTVTDSRILGHEGLALSRKLASTFLIFALEIMFSFHVSVRVEDVPTEKKACIRIVKMAAVGFWETPSMRLRPNISESRLRIIACT